MGTRMFMFILSVFIGLSSAYPQTNSEDFATFLNKFTNSASFQYERIKFPLANSILLLTEDEEEKEFPFTKEKWALLDSESFKEERFVLEEEESVYNAKFILDEPERKEFEAGYEESELDLRVVFELISGKWYVTDCYNGWYSFDLPAEELQETIRQVQEVNKEFQTQHP